MGTSPFSRAQFVSRPFLWRWLHNLVCLRARRQQYFGTFFLRNRPLLHLMRRLAGQKPHGATLRIAVLGCSIGAEVYSILWTIRSARPDLKCCWMRWIFRKKY